MTDTAVGISVGAQPVNLAQLEDELDAAGITVNGLGMSEGYLHTYDENGDVVIFMGSQQARVNQVLDAHVAMRDTTDEEYAAEFQAEGTTAERKQTIRDITAGLLPREQVPM